jgi:hypothetical protein
MQETGRMTVERRVDGVAWALAIGAALLTIVCRVIPYYVYDNPAEPSVWHFVPIGALCVFAGARLRHPAAFLLPLVAMLVSDLLLIAPIAKLGYSAFGWGTLVRYGFLLVYFLGGWLLPSDRLAPGRTLAMLLLGGLPFFVVSNFLVWLGDTTLYTRDLAGLAQCFVAALPFYKNTLLADVGYGAILFAVHVWLAQPSRSTDMETSR